MVLGVPILKHFRVHSVGRNLLPEPGIVNRVSSRSIATHRPKFSISDCSSASY